VFPREWGLINQLCLATEPFRSVTFVTRLVLRCKRCVFLNANCFCFQWGIYITKLVNSCSKWCSRFPPQWWVLNMFCVKNQVMCDVFMKAVLMIVGRNGRIHLPDFVTYLISTWRTAPPPKKKLIHFKTFVMARLICGDVCIVLCGRDTDEY
jgi:hypothetical protein